MTQWDVFWKSIESDKFTNALKFIHVKHYNIQKKNKKNHKSDI